MKLSWGALAPIVVWVAVASVGAAQAQSYGLGIRAGVGTDVSSGIDAGSFDDRAYELQAMVETEYHVLVRARAGRISLASDGEPDVEADRLGIDVEYQFKEDYFLSGVFLGGSFYRFHDADSLSSWNDGKDHFGFYGGIDGWFGIAPGWFVVPELLVERIQNRDPRTIGTLSVGLIYRF